MNGERRATRMNYKTHQDAQEDEQGSGSFRGLGKTKGQDSLLVVHLVIMLVSSREVMEYGIDQERTSNVFVFN
ncbi:unnamed protein product [Allacma fusca]|uniref:Uncharacterized protein n=1 Tax=Allacma fusca TaxID=39272 RepID=A0A8J2PP22_9HEXA|nr:unnamed protein product [Allacma fusca]